jgi:hypothetical protein
MYATGLAQTPDRERDGLKGSVKTVRVQQATIVRENGKQTTGPLMLISVISYDQSGYRTELALYDHNGALNRRIAYEYDPQTKKRSSLKSYNSQNVMVRKINDKYGPNGMKISSTIFDFNEDGSVFRRTELTHGPMGELLQVAEFDSEGNIVKKNNPLMEESKSENVASAGSPYENKEQPVLVTTTAGEYFDLDSHGNWTRGQTHVTFRAYVSGANVKTEEWMYREITYY